MRIKVLAQNDGLADQCQEYTHRLFKLPLGSISLNAYPKYGITNQQAKIQHAICYTLNVKLENSDRK